MAKACDWAVKFNKANSADGCKEVLAEYADETKELIALRTKSSKPEGKKSAADGAIREQRQKFLAAIRYVPSFIPEMFDGLVSHHINPSPAKTSGLDKQGEIDVLPRSELVSI